MSPTSVTAPSAVDTLALLGLAAEFEFEAFVRLADDAASAPDIAQRQVIATASVAALRRQDQLVERIAALGGDPAQAMAPFNGVVADFELRTTAGTWSERLLKAYVGYGIADDFLRLAARGADAQSRDLIVGLLDSSALAGLVEQALAPVLADDVAASRLALWGRRLAGDALAVVQGMVVRHPSFARLLDAGSGLLGDEDRITRMFAALTAEHTRRMDRLGLTA